MNKASHTDFKHLFESVPGLYLALSPDLYILGASDSYLEATLTKREEITGKYLFDVFPDNPGDPDTQAVDTMSASIKRVLNSGETDSWAIQRHDVRNPDGSGFVEKYWRPSNAPIFDHKGELKYILHSVEDVTEYVKLKRKGEVDFDKHVRHLEFVNRKLTHSNQELEQIVYIASHDLQQPLRTISNYIQLIREDYYNQMDKEADQYLDFITNSALRMRNLINDLLDYSRVGNKLNIEIVDCNKILSDVLQQLQLIIKEKNAIIESQQLPVINADKIKIEQLFQNLISNAIKFQKEGVVPVVKITVEDTGKGYEFAFSDNGIGIEEKYINRLFVIFQRLHSQTEFPGTGIGLAICKKIVLMHNGKIWIKSEPGKGSTFCVYLPKEAQ